MIDRIQSYSNGRYSYKKYWYDGSSGNIQQVDLSFDDSGVFRRYKYYWKNGNFDRKEVFMCLNNEAGTCDNPNYLAHEFFYTYDTKVNYKKNFTSYFLLDTDPFYLSTNNLTRIDFNDYYGHLDMPNPLIFEYKYNSHSLPFIIKVEGSEYKVFYR